MLKKQCTTKPLVKPDTYLAPRRWFQRLRPLILSGRFSGLGAISPGRHAPLQKLIPDALVPDSSNIGKCATIVMGTSLRSFES